MSRSALIPSEVLRLSIGGYAMEPLGLHGLGHWARVLENGLHLADSTGANRLVVSLFAVLHDCRRWNEGTDRGHGPRAAELVDGVQSLVPALTAEDADVLRYACAHHADGHVHDDPTIGTCWDADRLDLARVWIQPRPSLLCTDAAREVDRIAASSARASEGVVPAYVHSEWIEYLPAEKRPRR